MSATRLLPTLLTEKYDCEGDIGCRLSVQRLAMRSKITWSIGMRSMEMPAAPSRWFGSLLPLLDAGFLPH